MRVRSQGAPVRLKESDGLPELDDYVRGEASRAPSKKSLVRGTIEIKPELFNVGFDPSFGNP